MANSSLSYEEREDRNLLLSDPARRRLSVLNDIVPLVAGSGSASFVSKGSSPGLDQERVPDAILLTEYVITGNHPAISTYLGAGTVVTTSNPTEDKGDPVEGGAEEVKEDGDDVDPWA